MYIYTFCRFSNDMRTSKKHLSGALWSIADSRIALAAIIVRGVAEIRTARKSPIYETKKAPHRCFVEYSGLEPLKKGDTHPHFLPDLRSVSYQI